MLSLYLSATGEESLINFWSQFSSVAQLCPTLWEPMDFSAPGFSVHYQLPELTQTHVHPVSDAIQPSLPSVIPFKCCIITVVIALQH